MGSQFFSFHLIPEKRKIIEIRLLLNQNSSRFGLQDNCKTTLTIFTEYESFQLLQLKSLKASLPGIAALQNSDMKRNVDIFKKILENIFDEISISKQNKTGRRKSQQSSLSSAAAAAAAAASA